MNVYFATCDEKPDGTADDCLLRDQLVKNGVNVEFKIWSDESVDWTSADLVLIRSTWDYHRRLSEFLNWAKKIESETMLVNSLATLQWNSSKRYLLELEKKSVPIIPSFFFHEKQAAVNMANQILQQSGQVIIKPSVSAAAEHTFCLSDALAIKEAVTVALSRGEIIIQPFITSIKESGELSLVYLNSGDKIKFSHAVQKCARTGDFRVQSDFGGTAKSIDVSSEIIETGYHTLIASELSPLYARVDIIDWQTHPKISELEMIEPELFFRFSETAISLFANAIIDADK
jgi:glutathione synthase/RimK-type ligase-like ATP-grasp enzyme